MLLAALRAAFPVDSRRLTVLVALVLAVIAQRTCVLNVLKTHVALPGTPGARAKRLKRFVQFALPDDLVARFVLSLLPVGTVWLILDRTNWKLGKRDVNILLLSASWGTFSLPLVWTLLEHGGNSTMVQRQALLQRFFAVHSAFALTHPLGGLRADREFIGKAWFRFLRRSKLPICIRLKADTRVNGLEVWRRFVHLKPGTAWHWGVRLRVYGVKLHIVATTTAKGERLFLATEHEGARRTLAEYAQRWGCECLHQSLKGRGFDLEASHLTRPERVSTLLTVLAIAFVWCCLAGETRHEEIPIKLLKHGRLAVSLFRYGLDWIGEALRPDQPSLFARLVALLKPRNPVPYVVLASPPHF